MNDQRKIMRRVVGWHDVRMDGLSDLVLRARGASVLDVGCNRGMVGFEMMNNGARLVHGCDNYAEGISFARELFADLRNCESRFEVVDLTAGTSSLAPFGKGDWDIVLVLATLHKLRRVMSPDLLTGLVRHLGHRTTRYFGWRGTADKAEENQSEMQMLDRELQACQLERIHTSFISELGACAIWARR